MENNADSTIDYGRLNQELSATGYTTMSPEGAAKTAATLAALQDMDDEEDSPQLRPAHQGDYVLSERVYIFHNSVDHASSIKTDFD